VHNRTLVCTLKNEGCGHIGSIIAWRSNRWGEFIKCPRCKKSSSVKTLSPDTWEEIIEGMPEHEVASLLNDLKSETLDTAALENFLQGQGLPA